MNHSLSTAQTNKGTVLGGSSQREWVSSPQLHLSTLPLRSHFFKKQAYNTSKNMSKNTTTYDSWDEPPRNNDDDDYIYIYIYNILLYHIIVYRLMLYYTISVYYVMLYYSILYYIILCYTILYYTIFYYIIF